MTRNTSQTEHSHGFQLSWAGGAVGFQEPSAWYEFSLMASPPAPFGRGGCSSRQSIFYVFPPLEELIDVARPSPGNLAGKGFSTKRQQKGKDPKSLHINSAQLSPTSLLAMPLAAPAPTYFQASVTSSHIFFFPWKLNAANLLCRKLCVLLVLLCQL